MLLDRLTNVYHARPMSQISAIFGTDDDEDITRSLYLIANVSIHFLRLSCDHEGLVLRRRFPTVQCIVLPLSSSVVVPRILCADSVMT